MDPVTQGSFFVAAMFGAAAVGTASLNAQKVPVTVPAPQFTDLSSSLVVQDDFFGQVRKNNTAFLAGYNALPVPTTQSADYWNAFVAEVPMTGRGAVRPPFIVPATQSAARPPPPPSEPMPVYRLYNAMLSNPQ